MNISVNFNYKYFIDKMQFLSEVLFVFSLYIINFYSNQANEMKNLFQTLKK